MSGRSPSAAAGFELSAENAAEYLKAAGRSPRGPLACRELGGGVSNTVVLVETPESRFILKQALPQLRVRDEWLADRSRIFAERNALQDAARLLPPGWVPEVLWSDGANYLYAMKAAPEPSEFWKQRLLEGRIEPELARRAGVALGLFIRGSWQSPYFERRYADREAFDQLRTDPYYRTIAKRHPDIDGPVNELIEETSGRRAALVHGDWSPKNMMVTPEGMVFIDWECAHFGDPAFDSAFCINHFLLKAFHRPELAESYFDLARIFLAGVLNVAPADALPWLEKATARHLPFLFLARVDGKSPVEYLTGEKCRETVRRTAKQMISARRPDLEALLGIAQQGVRRWAAGSGAGA